MKTTTYLINYGVYFSDGHYESNTMRVKNCMSDLHAKVKLEDYLKRNHANFQRLVVYKCYPDLFGGIFNIF